jgi:hypothetical protein
MGKARSPTQIHLQSMTGTTDKKIHREVQQYIETTVAAFGGWHETTAGEMAMLLGQKFVLTMILRLQAELAAEGGEKLMDTKDKTQIVWAIARFQSEFRAGQVALGLARPRITSRKPQNLVGQPRDTIAAISEEYRESKENHPGAKLARCAEDKKLKVV